MSFTYRQNNPLLERVNEHCQGIIYTANIFLIFTSVSLTPSYVIYARAFSLRRVYIVPI